MKHSEKNIFIFDENKINKKYFYTVCNSSEADEIITSKPLQYNKS